MPWTTALTQSAALPVTKTSRAKSERSAQTTMPMALSSSTRRRYRLEVALTDRLTSDRARCTLVSTCHISSCTCMHQCVKVSINVHVLYVSTPSNLLRIQYQATYCTRCFLVYSTPSPCPRAILASKLTLRQSAMEAFDEG